MSVWLVWTVVVVAGIVLMRALREGSWERVGWFAMCLLAGLFAKGIPYLEGPVSLLPWGVEEFVSAFCGLFIALALMGFWIGLIITVFTAVDPPEHRFKRPL